MTVIYTLELYYIVQVWNMKNVDIWSLRCLIYEVWDIDDIWYTRFDKISWYAWYLEFEIWLIDWLNDWLIDWFDLNNLYVCWPSAVNPGRLEKRNTHCWCLNLVGSPNWNGVPQFCTVPLPIHATINKYKFYIDFCVIFLCINNSIYLCIQNRCLYFTRKVYLKGPI